uniref:Uncharacterized protein n=1 Tax=Cacopsylla melanoneura TaxID=428564 RepID=A0A8D9B464_9HEMI
MFSPFLFFFHLSFFNISPMIFFPCFLHSLSFPSSSLFQVLYYFILPFSAHLSSLLFTLSLSLFENKLCLEALKNELCTSTFESKAEGLNRGHAGYTFFVVLKRTKNTLFM